MKAPSRKTLLINPKHAQLKIVAAFAGLLLLLVASPIFARGLAGPPDYDPKKFALDGAAADEVARIGTLQPSKSPVLNEATREDIQGTLLYYNTSLESGPKWVLAGPD